MRIKIHDNSYVYKDPNNCPHCHIKNIPQHVADYVTIGDDSTEQIISLWQCANFDCRKYIIALYQKSDKKITFSHFINGLPKGPDWPNQFWN
jgi:hypothetical protein